MATATSQLSSAPVPPATTPTPTALERHASFFDPQGTGLITPRQTYAGMKRLGVALPWRILLTPVINGFLGYLTEGRPSLVIRIDRIAQGKHPYDSGSFGDDGGFDPAAFDALFANGATTITADEMDAVITARGNRKPEMGKLAGVLGHWFSGREVGVLFCIAADTTKTVDGQPVRAMTRATLRRFYDGTLFYDLARRRALVTHDCVLPRRAR
jgi:peroxygenase